LSSLGIPGNTGCRPTISSTLLNCMLPLSVPVGTPTLSTPTRRTGSPVAPILVTPNAMLDPHGLNTLAMC
jgi:hypothetical protein